MEYRPDKSRWIVLAIAFVAIVAIPGYLIAKNYSEREAFTFSGRVISQESDTAEPKKTLVPTSTWTPRPSATQRPTLTPIFTPSSTNPSIPGFDFSGAFVIEVVHLEEGGQSMVKIFVPRVIVGEFLAEVQILWTTWNYNCLLIDESKDRLFCVGPRLPPSDQAIIRVFEVLIDPEEELLVFETEFVVFEYIPSTSTPKGPPKVVTPTLTPSPTSTVPPTLTPSQTPTPIPTNTLAPPPSPQVTPPTPNG